MESESAVGVVGEGDVGVAEVDVADAFPNFGLDGLQIRHHARDDAFGGVRELGHALVYVELERDVVQAIEGLAPLAFSHPGFAGLLEHAVVHFAVGDVAVQKQGVAEAQVVGVPIHIGGFADKHFERFDEMMMAVVVAENEMEMAIGVRAGEVLEPADGFPDGGVGGFEGGPPEVESVAVQDEVVGLFGGLVDGRHVVVGLGPFAKEM